MKITQRKLNGYLHAKRDWISDNDNYNIEHFGITKHEYYAINTAINNLYGISGYYPILKEVNRELQL